MTWQSSKVLHILITLFEAVAKLDAGPTYLQPQIDLQGHELVEEESNAGTGNPELRLAC